MSSNLRDLLDLPSEVKKSDFVVRLTEGIARPEKLLESYAITSDLKSAFDRALTLVGAAMRDRQSSASYVHGSFGAGKSHFLAITSLLLGNDRVAWSQPELHELLGKHEWVKGSHVLRLHFHMVGARSLEEKVFAEYLARVGAEHPEAPVPPLFEDVALFENAAQVRAATGDETFFAQLNAGQGAIKGFGKLAAAAAWDPASFEAARTSSDPAERARLFSALVKTPLFSAYAKGSSSYVAFDPGLGILARHAASLGYTAVVLFLDELILWFASRASDRTWLNTEAPKLAKLVEAQDERRDVPIVSFVARQRDISEMVGDQLAGLDAQTLRDSLKFWDGRFDVIDLKDTNLPAIVEKRVVRARDAAARKSLDDAFARLRGGLGLAWGTLLGEIGDEASFRQVYPFSPALIECLVALSHYLQRERTALKVLMELLVEHLEDFEMGRVVPVGDLFDVLAGGEEPMDGTMRERFASARRIYNHELLPLIQARNETGTKEKCQRLRDGHAVSLGCSNCPQKRCRADNRLAKTLLLAALVPQVKVLRGLTASRLVQLNHGTLRSPIPGTEATQAVSTIRAWAAEVGKVRVGEQGDPTVSIVLEGVDLKPIVDAARGADSPGARRRKLMELLFKELEVEASGAQADFDYVWRGTKRAGSLYFGNVREMDDFVFRARAGDDFRVVIDYPFDEPGRCPAEDEARLQAWLDAGHESPSIVWLPSFFGESLQRDLGELVVLDRILEGDAWKKHLENLRPDDQLRARAELESIASQKRQRVLRGLLAAYGLRSKEDGELDPARELDRHYYVLLPGLEIRGLAVAKLRGALEACVTELLDQRFPLHPRFGDRVTRGRLEKALAVFNRVCEAAGQRQALTREELAALEPAEQLGFVTPSEGSATLRLHPFQEIDRLLLAEGLESPSVAKVRQLFDPGRGRGLSAEVVDFAVLAYASASSRELLLGGRPLKDPPLGKLPDEAELVKPRLPNQVAWQRALDMAGRLFGVSLGGRALNARNLRDLSDRLEGHRKKAVADRAGEIATLLGRWSAFYEGEPARQVTAHKAVELLSRLDTEDAIELVEGLAKLEPKTSPQALERHLTSAAKTARALDDKLALGTFEALRARGDPRGGPLLQRLGEVLGADAIQEDLEASLRTLALDAQRVLNPPELPKAGSHSEPVEEPAGIRAEREVVGSGEVFALDRFDAARGEIAAALEQAGPGARLVLHWQVTREKK